MEIRKTIDVLNRDGWGQLSYVDTDTGNRCIIGGFFGATEVNHNRFSSVSEFPFNSDLRIVAQVIFDQYQDRLGNLSLETVDLDSAIDCYGVIVFFNDHEDTCEADVIAVLEKAAIEAGE